MSVPWVFAITVLAGAVVLLGLLQLGLMRRVADVLERAEAALQSSGGLLPQEQGLMPGADVPAAFAAVQVDGQSVDVTSLADSQPAVVLLTSADCEPCHRLLDQLSETGWHETTQLVVVIDAPTPFDDGLRQHDLPVLYQSTSLDVSRALKSNVYPRAFALHQRKVAAPSLIPRDVDDLVAFARHVEADSVSTVHDLATLTTAGGTHESHAH